MESESCCEFHPPDRRGPEGCPQCHQPGKSVQRLTVGVLLKPEKRAEIPVQEKFLFCGTSDCEVVYFQPGEVLFLKNDLSVPVHQKEPDKPEVPVCYCFGWTPRKIRDEIESTGQSMAVDQIKAQVKTGNCYCEATNPQGSCCLGNVSTVVKNVKINIQTQKRG